MRKCLDCIIFVTMWNNIPTQLFQTVTTTFILSQAMGVTRALKLFH